MIATLLLPTAENVRAACEQYDRLHEPTEQAINELFRLFPDNQDLNHVLLKVAAINSFCACSIFALVDVARNIQQDAGEIDGCMDTGCADAVDKIAKVAVHGKIHNFYSFATKFCNAHKPDLYPIYDSRIDSYLWNLQQHNHFATFLHNDLCSYVRFREIMIAFRDFHGLGAFSFK